MLSRIKLFTFQQKISEGTKMQRREILILQFEKILLNKIKKDNKLDIKIF